MTMLPDWYVSLGLNSFSSTAPAKVTSLKVEPGSYAYETALLLKTEGSLAASQYLLGL
ncbi:hypothetical protein D3C76_1683800 [compost metagenome]